MVAKVREIGNNKYDGWYLSEYEQHIGYAKSKKKAVDFPKEEFDRVKRMCDKYNLEIMEVTE